MYITEILPKEMLTSIISLTSPRDACRLSTVSKAFDSVAASNCVWERFLPLDYQRIISESVSPGESSASSLNALTKKKLYLFLSHNPILLGDGIRSFAIDKLSGKKCYMLGARALNIIWGNTPRFAEIARLLGICWLEIQGRIETHILSPNTTYCAYFVYAIELSSQNLQRPVKLSLRSGNEMEGDVSIGYLLSREASGTLEGRHPHRRDDKWMEIEIGEFFNGQNNGVVEMRLWEIEHGGRKTGLVVHGIELRPKDK